MSRTVKEWRGATDDSAIPARVKLRVFERCRGKCCDCGNPIRGSLLPAYDHVVAIINGGANAESNLQLLCVPCHEKKTRSDVAEKSVSYRVRVKFLGLKSPRKKINSRGFPKYEPQKTASRPIRKGLVDG